MGLIRFYLALAVAAFHGGVMLGKANNLPWNKDLILGMDAWHAVLLFYVVSGFLISYVLEHKYSLNRSSTADFYQARFLRIFPLWWAVCAFSILMWGAYRVLVNGDALTILSVFGLFGLDWLVAFRDYPQFDFSFMPLYTLIGWTLGVEVTFYALAPFLLRSPRAAILVFGASILWRLIVWAATTGDFTSHLRWNFFPFPATAAFFLLGHFGRQIYHFRPEVLRFGGWLLLPAMICAYHMPMFEFDSLWFYAAAVLFALALPAVFEATKDNRTLNFFGSLTYPLYLTHMFCIVAFATLLKTSAGVTFLDHVLGISNLYARSYAWMVPLLAVCTVVAAIVHYGVEKPFTELLRLVLTWLRARIVAVPPHELRRGGQ
jgi:peptidoglycan/LPS O-acetylase OafA/YrhL